MKAAILEAWGAPLAIKDAPDLKLGTGEVLVDVVAAPVLHYANEVFSGERRYMLELPAAPGVGAVGRVREVGPDATRLRPGDWVFCDPMVRSRDSGLNPDVTLQGWSARGESGVKLQRYFRDGAFAEQIRSPTENVIALGDVVPKEASRWCALALVMVPYGGLLAANLRAGETVLVSGATGNYGAAAVAVAAAMGAGAIVAPGRNKAALDELARRFGSRLRPVTLSGDEAADIEAMRRAAGPIDCVFDILPPSAPASAARAAMMSVRPYGRVVLMGGVGMLGGAPLELPYPWIMRNCISVIGQWMYGVDAPARIVQLVRSGLLDLAQFDISEFPLDQANDAVAYAAAHARPFALTAIRP